MRVRWLQNLPTVTLHFCLRAIQLKQLKNILRKLMQNGLMWMYSKLDTTVRILQLLTRCSDLFPPRLPSSLQGKIIDTDTPTRKYWLAQRGLRDPCSAPMPAARLCLF